MNQKHYSKDYIDLAELLNAFMQHAGKIILASIICGIIGFVYSVFIATPLYSASAMMIVNSGERYDYITQDQLNSATTLVRTYSVIITSDTVMDKVKDNLGMQSTYKSTVKDISVASVDETQIMQITVTAIDPQSALDVCEEITNVAPDVLVKTVKAGSVELVSKASSTREPESPNIKRNTIFAVLFGFIMSSIIVALIAFLDNKVKGENDIKQADIAVLGVIPFYKVEEE
ncbi:MAG: Wzz/FepE/Etk N-terminal domain-containing protein [Lachnospiraceae bacterium]|nr:Wzz/FepE/Etk N-terminal domain-containing protein [Lachnospiraceae bacterium]